MEQRFELFIKNITSIYRWVQRIKNTEMTEFGLKGMHAMCLYFLGKYNKGLTASQLAKVCDEDKAAVSRTVVYLKERGLIKESESGAKRKYRSLILLTDEGLKIYTAISEKAESAFNAGGAGLSEEDLEIFYDALQVITGNLEKYFECIKSE